MSRAARDWRASDLAQRDRVVELAEHPAFPEEFPMAMNSLPVETGMMVMPDRHVSAVFDRKKHHKSFRAEFSGAPLPPTALRGRYLDKIVEPKERLTC